MPPHRPEVFVSATSQDLRTCRQLIKEALLTLGCVPVEQTNFPPDARTVREMLRVKITACDAVVHVAGEVYGAEPSARDPAEPRRSYTQLEYELATELGKPVYVFICGAGFPYDEHPPEDAERQALQQQHRARLQKSDHIYTPVGSRDELALRVHALQTRVETLSGELNKTRSWLGRGLAIGLVALTLLGGGIWWLNQRANQTDIKVTKLETELDKQRRYIKSVADAFTEQQSQLRELKLTDDEIFNRAVANVATKEKVSAAELRSGIDLFVAAIRADPKADFYDRALAEFAQKNFAAAAENAGQAGNAARDQYLAADKLAAQVAARADEARNQAREAYSLQGQSLYAEQKFGEAVTAFEDALDAALRAKVPKKWAELQVSLGMALNDWAAVVTGSAITEHRAKAVAAYRAALEVYTRQTLPQDWAWTQNNLGAALRDQADTSAGTESAQLLAEAIAAYRAALEVYTRQALPQDWAWTQNNLGAALHDQAAASAGPDQARLLAEAIAAYRAALEVYTRQALPQDWAETQNNLAIALRDQAAKANGSERAGLLREAVATKRAALEILTAEVDPEWHRQQLQWIAEVEAELKKP
jgi:tetratricopeptide (TPR) repeat protein